MSPPLISIDMLADTAPCVAIMHGPNGYTLGVVSQEGERLVFTRTSEQMYLTWLEAWDVALAEASSNEPEPEEEPDESEDEAFYRVHQADVDGLLVEVRWHAGLTFQVWVSRDGTEPVEVTAFTRAPVVSFEAAVELAREWFEDDGGRQSVIEQVAFEGLLS